MPTKLQLNDQQKTAAYIGRMAGIRGAGAAETSNYSALEELLAAVGGGLKPPVEVIAQLKGGDAGMPDFGLITADQKKRNKGKARWENADRGVVEVKKPSDDIGGLLASAQVKKYAEKYGVVLATNYWSFALAEWRGGKVKEVARCALASSFNAFAAASAQKIAKERGSALCEFLRRALSHRAPIRAAQDIATVLASFARESLALLEGADAGVLRPLRDALERALSMKFEGAEGEKFFVSTLAQTIFYGVFSAWLVTPDGKTFDWRAMAHYVRAPVMRDLVAEITNPARLGRLGMGKLLDGAADALGRVENKGELFDTSDAGKTVQYFYEPFLADFDPGLRKQLGVWYTPPEIVRYMVERADRVLRGELKRKDGLADDNVYVLDPCGGTGAFVAEVLRRIHKTCKQRGDGAMAAKAVKSAAMKRIFGFEILSASYVVAHWQIAALLESLGAPLADDERAAIYLTNSLTDWESKEQPPLNLPGLQQERDAANKIKQKKPILVILGNPPYNAFAGTSPEEEGGLVAPYKKGLIAEWGIKKFNLDDLYVRFFRMAENRIAKTGQGLVSFISNYSYTEEPSFVVMRENLLRNFDKIWVENMHGNRNRTERAPDGRSSDTIFAMRGYSPGIRQGVVIALLAKIGKAKITGNAKTNAKVLYRDDIDAAKADARRAQLLASLDVVNAAKFDALYQRAKPAPWNKMSFRPVEVGGHYLNWHRLSDFWYNGNNYNGLSESRGGALFGIDRDSLEERMRDYFDKKINWDDYRDKGGGLAKNAARFDAKGARKKALADGFAASNIVPYAMRPFDNGFCYYTATRPVWNETRPHLWHQYKGGNEFIVSRRKCGIAEEGAPVYWTSAIGDNAVISGLARYTPFYLHPNGKMEGGATIANLSPMARAYLRGLGFAEPDKNAKSAEVLWLHALAISYAPDYQKENAEGLRIDWPRIPLPSSAKILKHSAKIGAQVRAILDMQTPFDAAAGLSKLAVAQGQTDDLRLADSWGYMDGKGKVYPGAAKPEAQSNPPMPKALAALGAPLSVLMNGEARWQIVPARVWEYRIGGFQPAKKWLSYRACNVLKRERASGAMTTAEVRQFADIIRRIAALILLEPTLNQNYQTIKQTATKPPPD